MTTRPSAPRTGRRRAVRPAAAAALVALAAGAARGEQASADGAADPEPPLAGRDFGHWAFRPLGASDVPRGAVNPIDAFVRARLAEAGLRPAPPADARTLVRRLSFDLTGLPPDPALVEAFAADPSPGAYERLVDGLLDSPDYGRRWAQHWLDLVRFAESDGFEFDQERREAWRYRDWVVDALNADMPYDEFVRRQLAADELHADEPSAGVATGFLRCGPDMIDINLADERRHTILNEMTSTAGAVFLGLTFECAQCHHHKSDPISLQDFYRLRAFFENTVAVPEKQKQLPPTVREPGPEAPPTHVMLRGDFRMPGERVEPAFPRVLDPDRTAIPSPDPGAASSGRRAALARWIARPDNALALRVIANRLWQQHFGAAIVATPNDFGRSGAQPTHPDLLDWLAAELPRRGWSLKSMHRLIVTSETWRQASHGAGPDWMLALERDPRNRHLWRMNRRRLSGEEIRDAMLAWSGRLNGKPGGPGIRPSLAPEVTETLLKDQWIVTEDESEHDRRSVYLFVRRNLRFPMFDAFDRPDPNLSCPRRHVSTTAPQALTLLNSPLSRRLAGALADRVTGGHEGAPPDPAPVIDRLYRLVFGRPPTAAETANASAFLDAQRATAEADGVSEPAHAAAADLCLALFNANEAIHVD